MAKDIDLGIGEYQIGGSPDVRPPRINFFAKAHSMPTGADVSTDDRCPGEPEVVLVFHTVEAVDAMVRALEITRGWFDQPRTIDMRVIS